MLSDDFYAKIGRMTVAFGNLDLSVGLLAGNAAAYLSEDLRSKFTQQRLEQTKELFKAYPHIFGDELVSAVVSFAIDTIALYRERPDSAHGLWIQESDTATAWAMKLADEGTHGVRSSADEATVERLTAEATAMDLRAGQVIALFFKTVAAPRVGVINQVLPAFR